MINFVSIQDIAANVNLEIKNAVGPQTRWLDYIKNLDWNHLGLCASQMQSAFLN